MYLNLIIFLKGVKNMKISKELIVYFSHKGNNYVGGKIVNLSVGNTEVIAKKIQNLLKCDIFKIETVKSYSLDYNKTTEEAKKELNINARPEIIGGIENIDSYDTIFLGYPNWWGTMPMAVFTFLDTYNLSGKKIIPFCTHEGSHLGNSIKDLKNLCSDSKILDGLAIYGSSVNEADKDLEKWLHKLGSLK